MVEPRVVRDAGDRVTRLVDRAAGRRTRSVLRGFHWLWNVAGALLLAAVAAGVIVLLAADAPPMYLLLVSDVAVTVAWIRWERAELAVMRVVDRAAVAGAGPAEQAAAALPLQEWLEKRRNAASTVAFVALATVPVVLLLSVPFGGSGYLVAALLTAPAVPLAIWVGRRSRLESARVTRDARARAAHPDVAAHQGSVAPGIPAVATPPGAPDGGAEPAVLIGGFAMSAGSGISVEQRFANAMVCVEQGVYFVEATRPSGRLRRSMVEPEGDRQAVLAQAHSGELWRPERIKVSVAWPAIASWSTDGKVMTLQLSNGSRLRWQYGIVLTGRRVASEIAAQRDRVCAELERRLGPWSPG